MKKILLTLFLSILFYSNYAQIVDHFSNPKAKWYVRSTYPNASLFNYSFVGISTTIYGFKGDTLINGKTWLKMYSTQDSSFEKNLQYEGLLFSQNKVVEFLSSTFKLDTIYDFNLIKSDSVFFRENKPYLPQNIGIQKIDSIEILNQYYKRFIFDEPKDYFFFSYLGEIWMEGIGSIHGPLHPLKLRMYSSEMGDGDLQELNCTSIDDLTFYHDSRYKNCYDEKHNKVYNMYSLGTTWHFNLSYGLFGEKQGYRKYTVEKDTLIGGQNAKYITGYSKTYTTENLEPIIVYEKGNKAYFWKNNNWKLMYDFNLLPGDTLHKTLGSAGCDSGFVLIDSLSYLTIDDLRYIVQHVSEHSYSNEKLNTYIYEQEIIQKIGVVQSWTFGGSLIYEPFPICSILDNFWNDGGLRCFEDPEDNIYYNAKPGMSACDIITFTEEIKTEISTIYPNPTTGFFFVKLKGESNLLELYNSYGELIYHLISNDKTTAVNLSNQVSGVYLLKITNEKGVQSFQKIIKN